MRYVPPKGYVSVSLSPCWCGSAQLSWLEAVGWVGCTWVVVQGGWLHCMYCIWLGGVVTVASSVVVGIVWLSTPFKVLGAPSCSVHCTCAWTMWAAEYGACHMAHMQSDCIFSCYCCVQFQSGQHDSVTSQHMDYQWCTVVTRL